MQRSVGLEGRDQNTSVCEGNKTLLLKRYLLQQVIPSVEESITVAHIVVEASSIAEEIGNASALVGELPGACLSPLLGQEWVCTRPGPSSL